VILFIQIILNISIFQNLLWHSERARPGWCAIRGTGHGLSARDDHRLAEHWKHDATKFGSGGRRTPTTCTCGFWKAPASPAV